MVARGSADVIAVAADEADEETTVVATLLTSLALLSSLLIGRYAIQRCAL